MKAKRVTAKILAALLLLESCGVPAFAELSLTEVSLRYSSDASESAETAWENDISPKGFHFELPESFGEQADITKTETNDLKDETDASEDDFLQNIVIEWENENSGTDISSEEVLSDELQAAQNDFDTNETQSGTQVQPTTIPGASLKLETNGSVSIRFRASIAGAGRVIVSEYGFLIARTSMLDSLNHALDFELPSSKYIKGIAYNAESGIDHTYRIDEDGNFVFIATCTNIPLKNYVDYLTARPYAIYKTDDVETVLYGEPYSDSIYRTAKRGIQIEYSDIFQTVIDNAERNTALFLNANEIAVGETVQRTTQSNPDIDLLKFTPTSSRYYTFTLTSEKNLFYEIADAAGNLLSPVAKDETNHFYLEKSNVYYIRIRGERDSAYTACMTGSLDEAVVLDFDDNTLQGFSVSEEETGESGHQISVSDGVLTVTRTAEGNGGVLTPGNINVKAHKYRYLVFGVKSATCDAEIKIYYDTSSSGSYQEDNEELEMAYTQSIMVEKSEFAREYQIDLTQMKDGLFSMYYGNVNSFKFVIQADGIFKFDYIALRTEEMPQCHAAELSLASKAGNTYRIALCKQNMSERKRRFTVRFDSRVLTLNDACALTPQIDLDTGNVLGFDIEIITVSAGEIVFETNDDFTDGIINCLAFTAVCDADTTIVVE